MNETVWDPMQALMRVMTLKANSNTWIVLRVGVYNKVWSEAELRLKAKARDIAITS
tara:strand:+ start:59082 stop:59249 length:168 start_codon:yes stop_codon:yes gene_type:complete